MSKEFDDFIQSIHQINGICIACDEEKLTHQICMDCIVKTNHEISDEEIYKASREHITDGGGAQGWIEAAFRQGAVWYRNQLNKGGQNER